MHINNSPTRLKGPLTLRPSSCIAAQIVEMVEKTCALDQSVRTAGLAKSCPSPLTASVMLGNDGHLVSRVNQIDNEDLQRALLHLRDTKVVPFASCLIVSTFHQAGEMWKFAFASVWRDNNND